MSKKTTYNPLGNRVLIKQNTITEETTAGGIILTMDETNPHDREKQLTGVIISLGYKVDQELNLKKGLTVKFAKHSEVHIDTEEDLILVQDKDIQAIIIEGKQS